MHGYIPQGTGVFLICIHYENVQSSVRKFIHTFSKIFKITNYLGHTYLAYIHKTIMLRPFSFTTTIHEVVNRRHSIFIPKYLKKAVL